MTKCQIGRLADAAEIRPRRYSPPWNPWIESPSATPFSRRRRCASRGYTGRVPDLPESPMEASFSTAPTTPELTGGLSTATARCFTWSTSQPAPQPEAREAIPTPRATAAKKTRGYPRGRSGAHARGDHRPGGSGSDPVLEASSDQAPASIARSADLDSPFEEKCARIGLRRRPRPAP